MFPFADFTNFISKLSISKIINFLYLLVSYQLSLFFKNPIFRGNPATLSVEPTNKCNLHCPECEKGAGMLTRKTGEIDFELLKKITSEVKEHCIYLMLYFQGESFMHKNIFRLIEKVVESKIYCCISTNGHFISGNEEKIIRSGLDRLIVSLDGMDKKTYQMYRRGGDFDQVISGIQRLCDMKKRKNSKKPFVILQFLLFPHNQHQINKIKDFGKALGVDRVSLKKARLINPANHLGVLKLDKRYSRYSRPENDNIIKDKVSQRGCWKIWHSAVITWNGKVVPCCYDKDAEYCLGSLKNNTVLDVWRSREYQLFRKRIIQNRNTLKICENCVPDRQAYLTIW